MSWLTRDKRGNRLLLWPIRIRLAHSSTYYWGRHCCEIGAEKTPDGSTVRGFMPGLRGVFSQTIHLGRLKICLGKRFVGGT